MTKTKKFRVLEKSRTLNFYILCKGDMAMQSFSIEIKDEACESLSEYSAPRESDYGDGILRYLGKRGVKIWMN